MDEAVNHRCTSSSLPRRQSSNRSFHRSINQSIGPYVIPVGSSASLVYLVVEKYIRHLQRRDHPEYRKG